MKPPQFWFTPPDKPALRARLLAPLSALMRHATHRRLKRGPHRRVRVPVVSIGNLNLGGTGKTPMAIWLAEHCARQGITAHIITRGYKGKEVGPLRVAPTHSAFDVGDEAILLSAFAPVWVARDRCAGAEAAIAAGAQLLILDDALQNPSLVHDLSLMMIDAGQGFGNGRVFPAGPLREPLGPTLERIDASILIGTGSQAAAVLHHWPQLQQRPQLHARLTPLETGMCWAGANVIAFAGIGRPEKFYQTLRELGATLISTHSFADHEMIPLVLLHRLKREAMAKGAQLVTTEKDAARLPLAFQKEVVTLPVRLEIDADAWLGARIAALL